MVELITKHKPIELINELLGEDLTVKSVTFLLAGWFSTHAPSFCCLNPTIGNYIALDIRNPPYGAAYFSWRQVYSRNSD